MKGAHGAGIHGVPLTQNQSFSKTLRRPKTQRRLGAHLPVCVGVRRWAPVGAVISDKCRRVILFLERLNESIHRLGFGRITEETDTQGYSAATRLLIKSVAQAQKPSRASGTPRASPPGSRTMYRHIVARDSTTASVLHQPAKLCGWRVDSRRGKRGPRVLASPSCARVVNEWLGSLCLPSRSSVEETVFSPSFFVVIHRTLRRQNTGQHWYTIL